MENFEAEFKSISSDYRAAADALALLAGMDDSQCSGLAQSILEKRDCFGRIEQINSKVIQLSSRWKQHREKANTTRWEEIDRLADDALKQAVRLNDLCTVTAHKLQLARARCGAELAEVGKGARFLMSAGPSKSNYPKFIDSIA